METGNFEEQFWEVTERILKRMNNTEEARAKLAQAQVQEVMAQVEEVMSVVQPCCNIAKQAAATAYGRVASRRSDGQIGEIKKKILGHIATAEEEARAAARHRRAQQKQKHKKKEEEEVEVEVEDVEVEVEEVAGAR